MRIAVIGDFKSGRGGNKSFAAYFAKVMRELDVYVEYIGDRNFKVGDPLYPIAIQSGHNSFTEYNHVKTPAEVLQKIYYTQKRLYEQLRNKVYDAYIVQRMDFLPVLYSFNLTEKVPVWIPNHDISMYESLIHNRTDGIESPYRLLEMNKHFMQSGNLNILVSSDYLGKALTDYNPKLNVKNLPIEINKKIIDTVPNKFEDTEGVLWIGSATSYKNPKMFMEIVQKNPKIKFTAIFNTDSKGELTKIEKAYKAPNLTVKGAMPLNELIEEYKKHRIGLVTSSVETFCIVAQEHLCFHPTFICTKSINGFHNIFPEAVTFDGAQDFSKKIATLYNDEAFYNLAITKNRDNHIAKYSHDVVLEAYKEFKQQLEDDFNSKNKFRQTTTLGAYIKGKLSFMKEIDHGTVLLGLKYGDYALGQHSAFNQLAQFKRIEKEDGTYYARLDSEDQTLSPLMLNEDELFIDCQAIEDTSEASDLTE